MDKISNARGINLVDISTRIQIQSNFRLSSFSYHPIRPDIMLCGIWVIGNYLSMVGKSRVNIFENKVMRENCVQIQTKWIKVLHIKC